MSFPNTFPPWTRVAECGIPVAEPARFVIATSLNDSAVSQHFQELSRALVERGHVVILLTDGQRRDLQDYYSNPSIYTWPSPRPTRLRDAKFLYQLIRRHRPHCLIANFGATNLMTLLGTLLSVPCRMVWYRTLTSQIEQDSTLSPRWLYWLRLRKSFVLRMATTIIANSRAASEDVQRTFRVSPERCVVFPNALADPLVELDTIPAPPEGCRIVCVGRFQPSKGQDVLLRALPTICSRFPETVVEFVGSGEWDERLQALAQELGVAQHCQFSGHCTRTEVLRRMAAATLTVVPSRTEAFGWVNIESLAVGTPVVASNVGGIPDIIHQGMEGFLVPPDSPAELSARICEILADPELRATMSRRSRKTYLRNFEQRSAVLNQVRWLEQTVADARRFG